jgi:hypothetical protein
MQVVDLGLNQAVGHGSGPGAMSTMSAVDSTVSLEL